MSRLALITALLAAACSNRSKPAANDQASATAPTAPTAPGQKIAVPGAQPPQGAGGSAAAPLTRTLDDPRFHLQPTEGTLTVDPAQGKAGSEEAAAVRVTPATGYHVATDYPIKLTLEAPAGVTLAKAELTAGGHDKAQGDAAALSEKGLAFDVKATATKAGDYEIKGWFKFGVCDKESCHPKKQPITIALAAK